MLMAFGFSVSLVGSLFKEIIMFLILMDKYSVVCIMLRVSTCIFNFSRYGRCPICGLLRLRTNEGFKVKEVDVLWMNTWGILNRTNNMTRSWFSPFFIYVSFLHFFYFKESTTVTTDKQRAKRIQQKNIQQCGGQVAPNSIWLGPSNKTKLSFFQLVLKSYPHLTFPFTIKGRELPRFFFLFFVVFCFFCFFILLSPKNKSLPSSSLWKYKF